MENKTAKSEHRNRTKKRFVWELVVFTISCVAYYFVVRHAAPVVIHLFVLFFIGSSLLGCRNEWVGSHGGKRSVRVTNRKVVRKHFASAVGSFELFEENGDFYWEIPLDIGGTRCVAVLWDDAEPDTHCIKTVDFVKTHGEAIGKLLSEFLECEAARSNDRKLEIQGLVIQEVTLPNVTCVGAIEFVLNSPVSDSTWCCAFSIPDFKFSALTEDR